MNTMTFEQFRNQFSLDVTPELAYELLLKHNIDIRKEFEDSILEQYRSYLGILVAQEEHRKYVERKLDDKI